MGQSKTEGHDRSLHRSPAPSTPEQFGALLQSESARYSKVVREAGIKAD